MNNSRSFCYSVSTIDTLCAGPVLCPAVTFCNNGVVVTSKRCHFDVITSKWRRFDVITTLLLSHVFGGWLSCPRKCPSTERWWTMRKYSDDNKVSSISFHKFLSLLKFWISFIWSDDIIQDGRRDLVKSRVTHSFKWISIEAGRFRVSL